MAFWQQQFSSSGAAQVNGAQQQHWDPALLFAYQQAEWLLALQQQQQQQQQTATNFVSPVIPKAPQETPPVAATTSDAAEADFTDAEIQEFNELLFCDRKVPPSHYVCHCCYEHGHYIYDCPRRFVQPNTRTPYQGPKTSFGQFLCPYCKHRWNSPKTARDTPQKCNKCKVEVFPHKQFSMETAMAKGLYRPRSSSRYSGGGSCSPLSMASSSTDSGANSEHDDVFSRMVTSQLF